MSKNIYGFEKKKRFKPVNIIEIIIITIFAIVIVGMLSSHFLFSKDGVARKIFGNYIYLSNVTNMSESIPLKSVVIASPDKVSEAKVGDVVLCDVEYNNETITTILRIQEVQEDVGKKYFILHGDVNPENINISLSEDKIVAVCQTYDAFWGKILSFATSKLGVITVIIIPCVLLLAIQIIHIMKYKNYDEDDYDEDDEDDEDVVYSTLNNNISNQYEEQERTLQQSAPPVKKIYVGNEGKAEYLKKAAPTGNYNELNEVMKNPNQQSRMKIPSADSVKLNRQRSTVVDNFKHKPTSRDYEAASEISFNRLSKDYNDRTNQGNYERSDGSRIYYEKPVSPVDLKLEPPVVENPVDITIPREAVKPRETIAPPPKHQNNKTVEELMRVIDQAQSGLKK